MTPRRPTPPLFFLRRVRYCVMLLAMCLLVLTTPDAMAQSTPGQECNYYNGNVFYKDSASYFIGKCIEAVSKTFGERLIISLQNLMRPVLMPLCTLAIIFLAMKITLGAGGRDSLRDTMVLFFKILIVYWAGVGDGAGTIVEYMRAVMDGSQEAVSVVYEAAIARLQTVSPDFNLCGIVNKASPQESSLAGVFFQMDCLFDSLMGLNGSGAWKAAGIAVLLAGLIYAPQWALPLILGILFLIVMYVFAVYKVLLYTTTIYISLAILFGISPVVIPMWLFAPTRDIAIKWFNHIVIYMLLPSILMAYLMMMQLIFYGGSKQFQTAYSAMNVHGTGSLDYADFFELPNNKGDSRKMSADAAGKLAAKAQANINQARADKTITNESFGKELSCFGRMTECATESLSAAWDSVKGAFVATGEAISEKAKEIKEKAELMAARWTLRGNITIQKLNAGMNQIMMWVAGWMANIFLVSLMLSFLTRLIQDVGTMLNKGAMSATAPTLAGVERVNKTEQMVKQMLALTADAGNQRKQRQKRKPPPNKPPAQPPGGNKRPPVNSGGGGIP